MKGQASEAIACKHIEELGFQILERRKRIIGIEIDILARDALGRLSIIEVKSVLNASYEGVLTSKQYRRLERAAKCLQFWLDRERVPAMIYLAAVNQQGLVDLILLDVNMVSMSN